MSKRIFKWALRLGLIGAALIALLLLLRNPVTRIVTERRIRDQTGMEVKIGKFSSGLFSPTLTIESLKLYNTAEFGSGLFLDLPELHLEMDAAALARHKLRLTVARLNLAEVNVVKNEAGQTNIINLLNRTTSGSGKKAVTRKLMGDFQFDGVDTLTLSLGKARFIDLKDATRNRELSMNAQNQVFKNIRSEADIYGMLAMIWLRSNSRLSGNPADLVKTPPMKKTNAAEIKTSPLPVPPAPPIGANTNQRDPRIEVLDGSQPVP
jgi:hypothetical protein